MEKQGKDGPAVIKNRQKGEIETSILFFHMFKTQKPEINPILFNIL